MSLSPSRGIPLVVLGLAAAAPLAGQQRPAPFETLGVTLAAVGNVNRNFFHETWGPGLGVAAAIELPFYAGHAELGAEQLTFDSRVSGVPGFRARYLFVGWGLETPVRRRFRWRNGLRLGSYMMRFEDESLPDHRRHESEVGLELGSRLGWSPIARWQFSVAGQYRLILTEPTIRHVYLTAGVTRTFGTPQWLRDFLD